MNLIFDKPKVPNEYTPAYSIPISKVDHSDGSSTVMYGQLGLSKLELFTLEYSKAMIQSPELLEVVTSQEIQDGTAAKKVGLKSIEWAKTILKLLEDDAKQAI